jgi:hypothetical protein
MFDELQMLRDDPALAQLLDHYGQLAKPDRTLWQDRLMEMNGINGDALTRLHGELIAWGWLEQNTGNTAVLKPGGVANCYRITTQGVRALTAVRQGQEPDPERTRNAA